MNTKFEFNKTDIQDAYEIIPFNSNDVRGYFTKDYSEEIFKKQGVDYCLKEVFYAKNYKGVVRGLHFQREKPQAKLVRCISGSIYDVIVDLRVNAHTFMKWKGFYLTEENKREILVPVGCAHGYLALEESIVSYKCTEKFYSEYDDGIFWRDKDVNIHWPLEKVEGEIILSDKDKSLQSFSEFIRRYGGF